MNIVIVGLGLIGGSIAKALTQYTDHRVYAFNRTRQVLDDALDSGAIHGIADRHTLAAADVIYLCLYPEADDQMIAFTSQLPHLLACAYVLSPRCREHRGFSAGSYRDVSRVARINADMWTELFFDNQEALIRETDTLMDHLQQLRNALAENDRDTVHSLLEQGRRIKEELGE